MMAKPLDAGDMRHRLAFDKREVVDDGYGNPVSGAWQEQFTRRAALDYQSGNEAVMAARLEGRSIIRVRLRSDSSTKTITTDWRAREARLGTEYAIRDVDAVTDPKWVWLRIETGVAQ